MSSCYDCATCTGLPGLARSLGRSHAEVRMRSRRCGVCSHRLHRHLHSAVRAGGVVPVPEALPAGPPPPGSPLALLVEELDEPLTPPDC